MKHKGQEALDMIRVNRTTVIVTHRLRTVRKSYDSRDSSRQDRKKKDKTKIRKHTHVYVRLIVNANHNFLSDSPFKLLRDAEKVYYQLILIQEDIKNIGLNR